MNRTEKQAFVASLATIFQATEMVVVSRNRGLTVAEASDLRRRMRAAGATYR
ncbi:MAG: 50S ribosomal protein L10, partial [Acetobacteraceae bacterium]